MSETRSAKKGKRLEQIFNFIVNNEPNTLYHIQKATNIHFSSVHVAVKSLKRKNLIKLDINESTRRGRNATVYMPTLKGLLTFLSHINLNHTRQKTVKNLSKILEKKGKMINYPLFIHCRCLEKTFPGLYELFVNLSDSVLNRSSNMTPTVSIQLLRERTRQLAKGVDTSEKPTINVSLETAKSLLEHILPVENRLLGESFFMDFLTATHSNLTIEIRNKAIAADLHNYAESLLKVKERNFLEEKRILKIWLTFFNIS